MNFLPVANNNVNSNENNENTPVVPTRATINLHEGWLATGNMNNIVSVTYTSLKSDEQSTIPDRTNFNLRAHRNDVRFVSWNIPYQKLATVDSKGVIFVWVKNENRWSLELINDRSHPVTDMSWSRDGRMTVICYEDGFILGGSVNGQRYWSTILNNPQTKVSAVAWLPDMSLVLLGTTNGQIIVMDHHGNTTEIVTIASSRIRQLIYSCPKFYPDAPDTNATRFVNDEHVLACSFDNGQVFILNHYQDASPLIIETGLKGIFLDWSSPEEILLIGGHRRLTDAQTVNELLFYSRRGDFLHRTTLPRTNQPLTALCWAHGNDIVFVACGSFVYTIWINHQALPSMLTICQMKLRRFISKTSRDILEQDSLPSNLKDNLLRLYPSIIKGFLPDPKNLRAFVCQPLKSHLRLQCTMKRLEQDAENSSRTSNLSGATYVLYLEYLGGLIPLLTAKRISKICPDFIIFDPQTKPTEHFSTQTSENVEPLKKSSFFSFKSRSNTCYNMNNVNQRKISSTTTTNRSSLIGNRNSIYVAQKLTNADRQTIVRCSTRSETSSDDDDEEDEDDQSLLNLRHSSSRKKIHRKSLKQKYTHKLCTIAANIWGTKFKFYGHSSHLPDLLGCVIYKTSFLHLQPRQMTVVVANNDRHSRLKTRRKYSSTEILSPQRRTTTDVDLSNPNSPSASPMNLSRSISPAASIANFIRPISPPCIQVKEPLSPKFARASSTTVTHPNYHDDSHVSSVPESCFEPETYRNLSPLNSNYQKKLSFSDPTLNQTTKISHRSVVSQPEQNLTQRILHQHNDDEIRSIDELENQPTIQIEEKRSMPSTRRSRQRYTSPRHRMMTCTGGATDSMPKLTSISETNQANENNNSAFYVMQNRPPLWNEQSQVYQLDFGGRVTLESAKNFQIEFKGKQVIQFGRIENNCYTLDFEWPFSPLQAFAVALANITQRLK